MKVICHDVETEPALGSEPMSNIFSGEMGQKEMNFRSKNYNFLSLLLINIFSVLLITQDLVQYIVQCWGESMTHNPTLIDESLLFCLKRVLYYCHLVKWIFLYCHYIKLSTALEQ